ncbi:MAG TPA: hypothetical protein VMV29_21250 [Ktedonobacterales bacterium]|nr:hypothetical protein [Ktedonobacterales bacterium]
MRDDDELYRRFLPVKKNVVPLSAFTRPRTSDPDPAISVDLARETTPEKALEAGMPTHFKLGILRVGAVRSLGFTVRRDPMPDNPAHCIIEGVRTADDCDRLAEQATVYTPPAQ